VLTAVLTLGAIVAGTVAAEAAPDATCDCVEVGPYVAPETVEPFVPSALNGLSAASGARYHLDAQAVAGGNELTVTRVAGGATVLHLTTTLTDWGFSPDQDALLVTGNVNGLREVELYQLTLPQAQSRVYQRSVSTGSDGLVFSPHGEFFVDTYLLTGTNDHVVQRVLATADGATRHLSEYSFRIEEADGEEFGAVAFGFSPDDDEFFRARVASMTTVEPMLANLETGSALTLGTLSGGIAWSFSPCGSMLAIRSDHPGGLQDVVLRNTGDGTIAYSGVHPLATTSLQTTATKHLLTVGGVVTEMADAVAPVPDRCPPRWPDADLAASEVGDSSVRLTWTPAQDATGVTQYRVLRQTAPDTWTQVTTVAAPGITVVVDSLPADTAVIFAVEARDAAGNWSTDGPTVATRTLTAGPRWRDGSTLCAAPKSGSVVRLCWPRAWEGDPVATYRVLVDGAQVAEIPGSTRHYEVTGLAAGSMHEFRVEAVAGDGRVTTNGPSRTTTTYALGSAPAGTLRGQVWVDNFENGHRDAIENPIPGYQPQVKALRVGSAGLVLGEHTTTVNFDGTWELSGLDAGTWIVVLQAHNGFKGWAQTTPVNQQPHTVNLGANGVSGVDFGVRFEDYNFPEGTLARTEKLDVSFFSDLNGNGSRDDGEPPVAGHDASCYYLNTYGGSAYCRGTSGVDGIAHNDQLWPGVYGVYSGSWPDGWHPTTTSWYVAATGGDGADCPPDPAGGAAFGARTGTSTISGSVWVDDDADGVRDAAEHAFSSYAQVCAEGDFTVCAGVQNGTYTIPNLLPGHYRVVVTTGEGQLAPWRLSFPTSDYLVDITSDGTHVTGKDFGLEPSGFARVAGAVWRDVDHDAVRDPGEPGIPGVNVCLSADDYYQCRTSAATGAYEFTYLDPSGHAEISIDDDPAGLTLTSPTDHQVTVALSPGTTTVNWGYGEQAAPQLPGAPGTPHAAPGAATVALTWSAPASDGGGAITDYVVQRATSASGPWTAVAHTASTATKLAVTGLVNGTAYRFRIAAVNAAGTGAWSAVVTATPRTVAAKPTKVTASARAAAVGLVWVAPASTGGAPVTDYVVQRATSASGPWTTVSHARSTATKLTVTGLKNGTRYRFRVAAVNAAGTGAWSSVVTATPRTVPTKPTKLTASARTRAVRLTWALPTSTGGAPITDYVIQRATKVGGPWTTIKDGVSTSRALTVGSLRSGTKYWFRVAAVNGAGHGPWATVSAKPR